MKPIVAIVGRPNVGKSSLFNRLTGSQNALVDDFAGITRDRHYGQATWNEREFILVDTGGVPADDTQIFAAEIHEQIQQALQEADAIIVLLDGRSGVSPYDYDLMRLLHPVQNPVLFAVNKIDGPAQDVLLYDFHRLGVERLYPISCLHRYGLNEFMDDLVAHFPPPTADFSKDSPETGTELQSEMKENLPIKIALVGRPNVGKSSLVNRLLGAQRMIVSEIPGTTRDVIDSLCEVDGQTFLLMDTAGIRRKSRVNDRVEKFSALKTLRSLERCDIAAVILDAADGVTEQDIRVAAYAQARGCGCILLLNKWDLLPKGAATAKTLFDDLRQATRFMAYAPILTVSARTGMRVGGILPQTAAIYAQYVTRLTTHRWNTILTQAVSRNEPPMHKGKRLKFYFITQTGEKPPTLVAFVNYPEAVHFSYQRYLVNQMRMASGLGSTPLRLIFRQRTGFIDFAKRKGRAARKK